MVDTLIENAVLVTSTTVTPSVTIGIEDGRVAFVDTPTNRNGGHGRSGRASARSVIDADGRFVLPGLIDCHAHFGAFRPFEEDVLSETRAAAAGGVTTVFHVILEEGSVLDRLSYYEGVVADRASVDMHFWVACMTPEHLDEIAECRRRGLRGFKFFLSYKGDEMKSVGIHGIDLGYLMAGMERLAECDGIAVVHAENYELLQHFRPRFEERHDFPSFCRARPPICEEVDAYAVCRMALETGAEAYLVHVSSAETPNIAKWFRSKGARIFLETSPRYLLIDDEGTGLTQRELAVTTPTYHTSTHQAGLWDALHGDGFNVVATDSAANDIKTKLADGNPWRMKPSWQEMPTSLATMVTYGVGRHLLTLNQVVRLMSHGPAEVFGLLPRKGTLEPGSDADLVIVDTETERPVRAASFPSACDYSPYEGWMLKGWPVLTMVRGRVVMDDGRIVGEPGWGAPVGLLP